MIFGNWSGRFYFLFFLLWGIISIIISHFLPLDTNHSPSVLFFLSILPVLIAGNMIRGMYDAIVKSPGLFCTPILTNNLRQFAFVTGLALSILFTLPVIFGKNLNIGEGVLFIFGWFFLLLALYLTFIGAISWFLFYVILVIPMVFSDISQVYLFLLNKLWPAVTVANIILCCFCWFKLGDEQIRKRQQQLITGQSNLKSEQKHKIIIAPWVDKFFLGQLNKCSYNSLARCIWGMVYLSLAIVLSRWKYLFLVFLLVSILFGLFGNDKTDGIFPLLVGLVRLSLPLIFLYIIIMVCCWGLFLTVVYYICKKTDLILQSQPDN